MKTDVFRVTYRGEALDAGTMDVRDLAPALLSISALFQETGRLVYGDKADIRVHLKAVETGSFVVDLAVVESFLQQARDLLSGDAVQAALALKEIIVCGAAGGMGLFGMVKWLKGRKPQLVEPVDENTVRITEGNRTVEVPAKLLEAYLSIAVRQALAEVVRPLEQDGVASIEFRSDAERTERIDRSDAQYFAEPQIGDELVLEQSIKAAYSIVDLSFRERGKWRVNDGQSTFYVRIEDEEFLQMVDRDAVAFRKSDVLICDVRVRSLRSSSGLKLEHVIERVIEHKPAMRQMPLDISR